MKSTNYEARNYRNEVSLLMEAETVSETFDCNSIVNTADRPRRLQCGQRSRDTDFSSFSPCYSLGVRDQVSRPLFPSS
jgi:hypothetical protein